MKIGQAAQRVGVPIHVLRHWDEMGVVVPGRMTSGHRDYTEEHLRRLQVLQACQGVGMSLSDIRQVLHRHESGRTGTIERHLRRIKDQRARLEEAERFLEHVIGCEHDLLTRCGECATYASTGSSSERERFAKTSHTLRTI
ncbi:MerR family transcriptional regulator [Gordonia sp. CPCC 205333]|uniref:MerR family transcriptional regulator n=1 Tax=Gordonia sp. CPCC 205333 TaxID=3140790 RepID=UPI003AF40A44